MNVIKITLEIHVESGPIGPQPARWSDLVLRAETAACIFLGVRQLLSKRTVVVAECLQTMTQSPKSEEP